MRLYVAADHRLKASNTALHFQRVQRREKFARRTLQRPELYEIRTVDGCACGFINDEFPPDEDVERNRAALRQLIEDLLGQSSGELDLLACWTGDEWRPIKTKRIRAQQLEQESFSDTPSQPLLLEVRKA